VIPVTISFVSLAVLLLRAWFFPALPGERGVVTAIFIVVAYLVLEVYSRRVSLGSHGIRISKLMRHRELGWNEITHLGALVMTTKVYLLLTTTKGFYILSNNYERFPDLLGHLVTYLDPERVGEEVNSLIDKQPQNSRPVRSAWLMTVVTMAIMVLRLFIF